MGTRQFRVATVLGALVLVAACGSTVPVDVAAQPVANASGEAAQPGVSSPEASGPAPGALEAGPATDADTSSTVQANAPGPDSPVTSGSTSVDTSVGPGVTADTINIGIYTVQQVGALFGSLGIKGADLGDSVTHARASADWVNANGGAGGRKLRLIMHDLDVTNPNENQSACNAWTRDAKVFAMVTPTYTADTILFDCLRKSGVISVPSVSPVGPHSFREANGHLYMPSSLNVTRTMAALVQHLVDTKFFTPGRPVGVIRFDTATDAGAMRDAVRPILERAGLTVAEGVVPETGGATANQNFVLRFKNAGVAQVITTGQAWGGFVTAAKSQNYFPEYGVHSYVTPNIMTLNYTPDQLDGARGVGWLPYLDVANAQDPGATSPRATLCTKILRDAGQDVSKRSINFLGSEYCDSILWLKDVLDAAAAPNVTEFRKAVDGLGANRQSAITFSTRFGKGIVPDGASFVRPIAYDPSCNCFRYTGAPIPVP